MSPTPLVSVVIPAFNAEKFVDRAIESVLSQTYPNLELFVVDDGSTDRTAEIAASFADPRITTIRQPNRGVATARNVGMAQSTGPLIAFLDADDRWDPEKLEKQVEAIGLQPGVVAIGCLMRYESQSGKVLGVTGQDIGPPERVLIEEGRLMPFPLSSIVFERSAVDKVNGFDETLRLAQDLDLLARISKEGHIGCVTESLGAYVIHSESASAQHLRAQRMTKRFIRERLTKRAEGGDLPWEEFEKTYRPTWAQSYGDLVQGLYRRAGELVAEERWARAWVVSAVAFLLGPRYTLRRFISQREWTRRHS